MKGNCLTQKLLYVCYRLRRPIIRCWTKQSKTSWQLRTQLPNHLSREEPEKLSYSLVDWSRSRSALKVRREKKQLSQISKVLKYCSLIIKSNHLISPYITLYRQNLSSELISHRETKLFQTSYDIMLNENLECKLFTHFLLLSSY